MRNKFSKPLFMIINLIWAFTLILGASYIRKEYNINLWIYVIVTTIVVMVGQMLIKRIFMKIVNK